MQQPNQPIGVFDSGLGGLSVLNAAMAQLPNESFIYVADSLYAPYGEKSDAWMLQRAMQICQFLLKKQVKLLLIACNTATLATVAYLRQHIHVPIVAIEPGIKPAVACAKHILMLATSSTLKSRGYQQLLQQYQADAQVINQACVGWVELVESHQYERVAGQQLIAQHLQAVHQYPIEAIVLGCTHYPFLKAHIQAYLHTNLSRQQRQCIKLIDTGAAVIKQLQRVLINKQLAVHTPQAPRNLICYSTVHHSQLEKVQSMCPHVRQIFPLTLPI